MFNPYKTDRENFDNAIGILFDNLDITNWEDSHVSLDGSGEPNTLMKITVGDKIDELREFIDRYVNTLEKKGAK